MSRDDIIKLALEQLRCNTDNMNKGMSKSIQKLCARENREVLAALKAALAQPGVDWESKWAEEFARRGHEVAALERQIAALAQQEPEPVMFTVTKTGALLEWEPTANAFALPDGKHPLYSAPPRRAVVRAAAEIGK